MTHAHSSHDTLTTSHDTYTTHTLIPAVQSSSASIVGTDGVEGGRFVHVDRTISLVVQPTIPTQEVSTLVEHVEKLHVLTASTITCQNWKPLSTNHGNVN